MTSDSGAIYQVINLVLKYSDKQLKEKYFLEKNSLTIDSTMELEIINSSYHFLFSDNKMNWDSSALTSKYLELTDKSQGVFPDYYFAEISIPYFNEAKTICTFFMYSNSPAGIIKTKQFIYQFQKGKWHYKDQKIIKWVSICPEF